MKILKIVSANVWLAEDRKSKANKFVALKVFQSGITYRHVKQEAQIMRQGKRRVVESRLFIRMLRQFYVPALEDKRLVISLEYAGINLLSFIEETPMMLTEGAQKATGKDVFNGLDHLHQSCGIM